tara:strand:+ start:16576 stop:16836 length:261 start_codon:yes stop_codon:yes gene_type:complete
MPKYNYQCTKCKFSFEKRHAVSEKVEKCPKCDAKPEEIKKLPSFFRVIKKQEGKKTKPGRIVKKHIEEAKKEVQKQKIEMQKEMEK